MCQSHLSRILLLVHVAVTECVLCSVRRETQRPNKFLSTVRKHRLQLWPCSCTEAACFHQVRPPRCVYIFDIIKIKLFLFVCLYFFLFFLLNVWPVCSLPFFFWIIFLSSCSSRLCLSFPFFKVREPCKRFRCAYSLYLCKWQIMSLEIDLNWTWRYNKYWLQFFSPQEALFSFNSDPAASSIKQSVCSALKQT